MENNNLKNNYNMSKIYTVEYLLNKLQKLNYFGRKIYVYEHYKEFLKNPSILSLEMIDNHASEYCRQIDVDFNIGKRIYTKFKFYKECLKYVFYLLDEQERETLFNNLSMEDKNYLDYVLYHKFPTNVKHLSKLLKR